MDLMYLDNLDEYVNDESNIATFKWLSLTLGVSANVAKQMLFNFVQKRKSTKGSNLTVTYLVSGISTAADGTGDLHQVLLVRDENFERVKASMKKLLSVHIYSVQKAALKDLNLLFTANYDIVKENVQHCSRYSGIKCVEAKIRTIEDTAQLKRQLAYQPTIEESNADAVKANGKISAVRCASQESINSTMDSQPGKENKIDDRKEKKINVKNMKSAPTKDNQIASMFSRQKPKLNDKKEMDADDSNKKMPSASRTSDKKSPLSSNVTKTELKIEKKSQQSVIELGNKKNGLQKQKQTLSQAKSQTDKGKNKKEKEEILKNKRKRIVLPSDSESSEEAEDEDHLPTPSPSPSPPPHQEVVPLTQEDAEVDVTHARKRRKLVDKTFLDEDGFLVTKKEYVLLSESEDDEEPIQAKLLQNELPKKPSPKADAAKDDTKNVVLLSPMKQRKQASIMNFFKKK